MNAYGPDADSPPSRRPRARRQEERYARRHNFFWLPCPLCGTEFSGAEWGMAVINDPQYPRGSGRGIGICPWCEYDGKGEETLDPALFRSAT